jgi:hypothetical protein
VHVLAVVVVPHAPAAYVQVASLLHSASSVMAVQAATVAGVSTQVAVVPASLYAHLASAVQSSPGLVPVIPMAVHASTWVATQVPAALPAVVHGVTPLAASAVQTAASSAVEHTSSKSLPV